MRKVFSIVVLFFLFVSSSLLFADEEWKCTDTKKYCLYQELMWDMCFAAKEGNIAEAMNTIIAGAEIFSAEAYITPAVDTIRSHPLFVAATNCQIDFLKHFVELYSIDLNKEFEGNAPLWWTHVTDIDVTSQECLDTVQYLRDNEVTAIYVDCVSHDDIDMGPCNQNLLYVAAANHLIDAFEEVVHRLKADVHAPHVRFTYGYKTIEDIEILQYQLQYQHVLLKAIYIADDYERNSCKNCQTLPFVKHLFDNYGDGISLEIIVRAIQFAEDLKRSPDLIQYLRKKLEERKRR